MFDKKSFGIEVFKSDVISLIISLILVLLFAFLINLFSFSDATVKPVNIIIKIIYVFTGCFLSIKTDGGLIKGIVSGVIALITAYFLFGLLGGGFKFGINALWEVLLGLAVGGVSGVIAVNVKGKNS